MYTYVYVLHVYVYIYIYTHNYTCCMFCVILMKTTETLSLTSMDHLSARRIGCSKSENAAAARIVMVYHDVSL